MTTTAANVGLVAALQTAPAKFQQNFCACAMKREGQCPDDCDDYMDPRCICDEVTTTYTVSTTTFVFIGNPITTTIPVTSVSYIFTTTTLR